MDVNEGRLHRNFCEITTIGRGQFSSVLRARSKIDNRLYAVKKTCHISRGLQESQLKEVIALATASMEAEACRNIVLYFSSWLEDGRLHIQTELCQCSLRDRMHERQRNLPLDPRFSQDGVIEVMLEVSSGLATLHARNFVHLDIKPDNVLVSCGPQGCYKIADLGLATAAIGSGCDDVTEGDCRYLAMEVLRGDFSSLAKADVFSLGLVAFEVATNPRPLPLNGDEWRLIREGHLDVSLIPTLSQSLLALLCTMVDPAPSRRPSCEELCQHLTLTADDELKALEEEVRRKQVEAEQYQQLTDAYRAEILSLKEEDHLNGNIPRVPYAGGRPVASPALPVVL
jgi:serine/threonine protein kinase